MTITRDLTYGEGKKCFHDGEIAVTFGCLETNITVFQFCLNAILVAEDNFLIEKYCQISDLNMMTRFEST